MPHTNRNANRKTSLQNTPASKNAVIESLENRRLLHGGFGGFGFGGFGQGGNGGFGRNVSTIEFDQAPAVVQTGLTTLATTDNVAVPTASQSVHLANANGVETYSISATGTGISSLLTVDASGNPVTAPTHTTPTVGDVTIAAVNNELTTIATALGLTAPSSTTPVKETTPAGSTVSVYTFQLSSASGSRHGGRSVQIDSNGDPVGNQNLPFSVFPSAIQTGLNNAAPTGATALDATSTQNVRVRTLNGVVSYSTTFNTTGTTTTVTVNAGGQLTKLPTHTTDQFQNIPQPTQTEIQTLATADGVADTISTTQNVQVYDEANGTVIYSVTLQATKTGSTSGQTYTVNLTLAADQNGNPTVAPNQDGGDFGANFGNFSSASSDGFGFFGVRGHRRW